MSKHLLSLQAVGKFLARITKPVSRLMTALFLVIAYFVFLTPFALVYRLIQRPRSRKGSNWNDRVRQDGSPADLRRMY